MRNDWTPPPRPSEEQIDRAAADLLQLAELEPMRKGAASFRRHDLGLIRWWDLTLEFDCDGGYDEVNVKLDSFYINDDSVSLEKAPERTRRHNLARCRTALVHAMERRDEELVLMGEAIREDDQRRALAALPGGDR